MKLTTIYGLIPKLRYALSRNQPFALGYQKLMHILPDCPCGGRPIYGGYCNDYSQGSFEPYRIYIIACDKCWTRLRGCDEISTIKRWVSFTYTNSKSGYNQEIDLKWEKILEDLEPTPEQTWEETNYVRDWNILPETSLYSYRKPKLKGVLK